MQPAFTFETGASSHLGKVRVLNEDRFITRPDVGLWAVADGMGGHKAGDRASASLVDALNSIGTPVSPADLLARFEDRIIGVNAMLRAAAKDSHVDLIGTTVAAVLVHGRHYACVWSGDSRVYLLRSGKLEQLSRDHTEVQDLVERGILAAEEARTWPRRNVITRAIGVADDAELECRHGSLASGDVFLICSDGLTSHVEDAEIARLLGGTGPQRACDDLVSLTLRRGATDNVTVVAVACRAAPAP
jgi:protein phosphatase